MKKRRRWWLLAVIVIVVAAAVAGGVLWFTRGKTATVHYLTSTAATGTISQTVQTDFTLTNAQGATTIALAGSSSSSSSGSSTTAASTTSAATSSTGTSAAAAVAEAGSAASTTARTTFAAYGFSPSPSPTPTPTPTPAPTPSKESTVTPTPHPTGSGVPTPAPSASGAPSGQTGGSSSGLSSSAGSGTTSTAATTTSATSSGISGVVSRLTLPAGATPRTLQRLLLVSGKPVFAFVSPTPLYTNLSTSLSSGAQRVNVAVLQRALKVRGYYKKAINGRFTAATKKAFKAWQGDNGLSKTGILDINRFVWVPTGAVLSSWSVNLGSHVSGGTTLASISAPSELTAQALVGQSDLADLKVGQKAQMTIDGYTSDTFTGVITYISSEPASSSSTGGSSSSTTQYTLTIKPSGMPTVARSGMTGTLEIVLAQAKNVLLVPTSAVSGTSGTPLVRVMQNGTPVYRQVQTGMATSASTEITSGLTAGEIVVTGQYTDGATTTTSSSSSSSRLGGSILSGGAGTGGPPAGGFPAAPGAGQ